MIPDPSRLINVLKGSRVFIQTHNFPDRDAVASACGLQCILRHFGIDANLCYKGTIENMGIRHIMEEYHIHMDEYSHIEEMTFADKVILVDGQKFNANMTDLPGDEVACIDHHPANDKGEYAYKDIRICGACSSIIDEYFRIWNVPMDRDTATLLLYGLRMDTDNLRRGVTELDVEAFRHLFPLSDDSMLKKLAGRCLLKEDLRAFGTAIETITLREGLGMVRIPFKCDDHLIAQVADFILTLAEVDTAIVYSRRDNGLKFSARTLLPQVHCGDMLLTVLKEEGGSGGGHPHMAGGFLPREKLGLLYDEGLSWEERTRMVHDFTNHLAGKFECFLKKAAMQARPGTK